MKVNELFKDPFFSNFTKTVVRVGELLEKEGWELKREYYSQGVQTLNFKKGRFLVDVHIEEQD